MVLHRSGGCSGAGVSRLSNDRTPALISRASGCGMLACLLTGQRQPFTCRAGKAATPLTAINANSERAPAAPNTRKHTR